MRHVTNHEGGFQVEMEIMAPLLPSEEPPSRTPDLFESHVPRVSSILVLPPAWEGPDVISNDSFADKAREAFHQAKGEFSAKDTAFSTAGLIPEALKELGHHIPGVGAVLSSVFLADDMHSWRALQVHIDSTRTLIQTSFEPSARSRMLENTLGYVLSQLERRSEKLVNSMRGKTLQVIGSGLTFAGLFTKGLTAIPGLCIGLAGTLIKSRIWIRSGFNYLQRKWNNELSVNRKAHANLLYGLTLQHLSCNCAGFPEAQKAVEMAHELSDNLSKEAPIAYTWVSSIIPLNTREEIDNFIQNGLWGIMGGIKS